MRIVGRIFTVTLALFIGVSARAEPDTASMVDLLLQRESIHNVIIDDKRERIYFERIGAKAGSTARMPYTESIAVNSALKKVFVAPMIGGVAEPLFKQEDDTGYFFASTDPWSPGARYLAIYRYTDGMAQPGVYDLCGASARFFEVAGRFEPHTSSLVWISDHEFVFVSDRDSSAYNAVAESARELSAAREEGWRKGHVTAQVYGGGRYVDLSVMAPGTDDLSVINVKTGKVRHLVHGVTNLRAPKPAARTGVVMEEILYAQDAAVLDRSRSARSLSIVDLSTGEKTPVENASPSVPKQLGWSASGRYLLIKPTSETAGDDREVRVESIFDMESKKIVERLPGGAADFAWIGDRLIYMLPDDYALAEDINDADRIAVPVTTPPPVAVSVDAFFYLDEGDLWRAHLDGRRQNLTGDYPHAISLYKEVRYELSPPTRSSSWTPAPRSLVEVQFAVEIDGRRSLVKFSGDGSVFNTFPVPQADSKLLAATFKGAAFLTNTHSVGSRLQYVATGELPRTLYHFNRQLADVKPTVGPIRIDHQDYEGEDVASWLFLPPGAVLDTPEPLPLVVVAYAGHVFDEPPLDAWPYGMSIWDLYLSMIAQKEVYLGEGYAVLMPSIPYIKDDGPGEPMKRIVPAILSALDGAIETGFVDPGRTALVGHSFGGYTALSVAVQTDRFQAIVAMAPLANLVTSHGQFLPGSIMNGDGKGRDFATFAYAIENAQARMKAPPWRDADRYIRNSPVFHAENVRTPLLLIHGEFDGAGTITQSEEMFTALYRQNKDVVFVRYMGEVHTLEQPQHQRDMWKRTFGFLRDYGVAPRPRAVH